MLAGQESEEGQAWPATVAEEPAAAAANERALREHEDRRFATLEEQLA